MLQDVVFPPELSKGTYRARRDELKERLMVLQQQALKAKMGTVVIFEGWGAAGKGSRISDLVVNLDPRAYSVHTMEEPVGYDARLPFMARYWGRLGAHGTMTIFDQAYYDELSRSYVEDVRLQGDPKLDPAAREAMARRAEKRIREHIGSARDFENQLEADGYLIVRFFLHITRDMQSRRIMDLMCDPSSAWKVDDADIRQIQHYGEYERIFDRWLAGGNQADWVVVPAEFKRNANIQIMEALAERMDAALRARGVDTSQPIPAGDEAVPTSTSGCVPTAEVATEEQRRADELARAERNTGRADKLTSHFELKRVKSLSEVRERGHVLAEEDYKRELKEQQERLSALTLEMYRHRVPLVIAYEGWDAAGKGGNIKRVTAAMDARDYKVWPIGAPSKDELAHPFLWRFWTKLPRSGHAADLRPHVVRPGAGGAHRGLCHPRRVAPGVRRDQRVRGRPAHLGGRAREVLGRRVSRGAAATVPRPRERPRPPLEDHPRRLAQPREERPLLPLRRRHAAAHLNRVRLLARDSLGRQALRPREGAQGHQRRAREAAQGIRCGVDSGFDWLLPFALE